MKGQIIICAVLSFFGVLTFGNNKITTTRDVPPTIYCTNYTIGCENASVNCSSAVHETIGAMLTQRIGCWCQNNGKGPACPAWLTCPKPTGFAVFILYIYQDYLPAPLNSKCHCQCEYKECPSNNLPIKPCIPNKSYENVTGILTVEENKTA